MIQPDWSTFSAAGAARRHERNMATSARAHERRMFAQKQSAAAKRDELNRAARSAMSEKLINTINKQQKAANLANQKRYDKMLAGVMEAQQAVLGQGSIYDEAQENLERVGDAGRGQIDERLQRQLGESQQNLTTRGLANTTVVDSMARGIESDAQSSHLELEDTLSQRRTGLLTQKAGTVQDMARMVADARLSRQDTGPDMSQYASILQLLR